MSHILLRIRSIPPEFHNRTITSGNLLERVGIILIVLRSPGHVVEETIPRRQVESGLYSQCSARIRELAQNISLTMLPGAVSDRMVRIVRREQPTTLEKGNTMKENVYINPS